MRRILFGLAVVLLVAPALVRAQQFGASAAIHGDQAFVGEPAKQNDPATVYIYDRSGDGWIQTGTLMAPKHDGGDYFGRFIAVDDHSLIVGGTAFEGSTGSVWIYQRVGDDWELADVLRPADVAQGDSFGRFGLLHDDLLFISSLGHNGGRGAIWVFHRGADGQWTQEAKLEPGDEAPEQEYLGWSLAFDGERLISGALQASRELQNRGAAYVFHRSEGEWAFEARLALAEDDANPGDGLGSAVAWLDGRALVGVPGRNGGIGEVMVYQAQGESWTATTTLSAPDRSGGARFGNSVTVEDGAVWVGATGAGQSGRVYRFEYGAGDFGGVSKLAMATADVGDGFGSTITVVGGVAVIGATGDDMGLGSAAVLEQDGAAWSQAGQLYGPDPASLAPLTAGKISCDGGTADQFPCRNVDVVAFLPLAEIGAGRGARTNDVWGWTDPESGREYAVIGRTDGTSFIDLTNPESPVYLGELPKTEGTRSNVWRDIKVYDNHAYVVADGAGQHGMQVFDLTRLRDVPNPPATFEADANYDKIGSAHNVVINEETGFAYAVGVNSGGETCGGGLHMIDIREPGLPTFAGCFADPNTGNSGTGYSHDAQCVLYDGPDTEYVGKELCFGSNETALSIADVSDKENPIAISTASYPNVGYAHQGWLTADMKYFFMDDEGDESSAEQAGTSMAGSRTLIWDVQDLDDPIMIKEHYGEALAIDHNLYIKDGLMYQSNNSSGLRILDVSDPENPTEVGFFDPVPWDDSIGFNGTWSNYPYFPSGTIVATSRREGVFFLKYTPQDMVP